LDQDADIVAFLYREDYYKPDTEKRNVTELHIAKHRNGPLGMVEFYFRKEFSTFEALDKEHEDIANM
jgi:replicative DNA helicase